MTGLGETTPATLAIAAAIALAGGFLRGFTGFGSNLLMVPLFSLVFGPLQAVLTSMVIDVCATVPLAPDGMRSMDRRVTVLFLVGALFAAPVGGVILVYLDPEIMRRVIAVIVILFAVLMLRGWTYARGRSTAATAGFGAAGGLMTAATSMGGPPLVLYMLGTGATAAETRGSMNIYSTVAEGVIVAGFLITGVLTLPVLIFAAVLLPAMLAGTWAGARVFRSTTDRGYRLAALWLLVVIGVIVLIV